MDQFSPRLDVEEGVVAVRMAPPRDGGLLAPTLMRAWPIDRPGPFEGLLREIDEAERDRMNSERRWR